jgi:hypothetical protein
LPKLSSIRLAGEGNDPRHTETEFSFEYAKRITPDLQLGVQFGGTHLDPARQASRTGLNNLELSLKYQFFKSDFHETVLTAGFAVEVGGTGFKSIGAEPFSVMTPAVLFGKGMGDLSEDLALLRPFAVTGLFGTALPTETRTRTGEGVERHPNKFVTGVSVQYDLRYLQSHVMDIRLRAPFDRLIPLVEFTAETPLDRGGGVTLGSINPGVIWAGEKYQVGLEVFIPINRSSGAAWVFVPPCTGILARYFRRALGAPCSVAQNIEHRH